MSYKIEECRCGSNDWELIAQEFICETCTNRKRVHKYEGKNPMADFVKRVKRVREVREKRADEEEDMARKMDEKAKHNFLQSKV